MGCLAIAGLSQQDVACTHFIHLDGERQCGIKFKETMRWQGLGLAPPTFRSEVQTRENHIQTPLLKCLPPPSPHKIYKLCKLSDVWKLFILFLINRLVPNLAGSVFSRCFIRQRTLLFRILSHVGFVNSLTEIKQNKQVKTAKSTSESTKRVQTTNKLSSLEGCITPV